MFPQILQSSFLVRVSVVLASVTALADWYVDQNALNCREGTGAPDNPFCSITAAVAEGDSALALKLARAAVARSPEDPRIHDTLAWALFANGLDEEALRDRGAP